jgi:uncharacterized protein YdhG (YjbR/CyaY superfamily)
VAKTDYQSVDEYIRTQPPAVQDALQRVRGAIRKAAPKAEEKISYQIPGYRLNGGVLIFFAAWKEHYAIYPATKPLRAAFAKELERYEIRGNTIRFSYAQKVPVAFIAKLTKFRAAEAEAAEQVRLAKKAAKRDVPRPGKPVGKGRAGTGPARRPESAVRSCALPPP